MKQLVGFFLALLMALPALALPSRALSLEEHNALVPSRICLDNAANFQKKGIVASAESYQGAVSECLAAAKATLGRDISFNELLQNVKTAPELTTGQKVGGWVTGFSILQILGALGVGVFGAIFLFYAAPLFLALPKEVYEAVLYVVAVGLSVAGLSLGASGYLYGFIGVLLFAGSLFFTVKVHNLRGGNGWQLFLIIMCYAGVFTLLYQSTLIGYVAVLALLCAAGFIADSFGLGYVIGFEDEKAVPIGTTVAFAVFAVYFMMRMKNVDLPYYQVFAPAAYWLGSFVCFLGLLIMSSKYYTRATGFGGTYIVTNGLMLVGGVGAIILGSTFGVSEVAKIGGTFLVLWAVEKYTEVTMHGLLSASFFGLVGSGGLFWFSNWALANSEKVGPYLLFVS